MKKIRLLAVLLAILMLPLSLLVACKDDTPDPDPDPDPGVNPGEKDPGEDEEEYDKDGAASGYLMFFNFDAAGRGDLRADTKPYSSYLNIDDDAEGVSYIVTNDFAKSGNSLLIQREGSAGAASFELDLAAVNGLGSSHTVEFDVKVGDGYITDDITFFGTKYSGTNNFLKLTAKGVCDGSGNMLYEYTAEDDWLSIAVAIDDAAQTFNIYVNGAKCTSDISYKSNELYGNWTAEPPTLYTFKSGTAKKDFYVHFDNVAILAGTEPTVRVPANDNVTYTATITDKFNVLTLNDKDKYFEMLGKTYETKVKNSAYGVGVLLSDSYAVVRVNNNTEKYTPVVYDYGVEMGTYIYGADFGNKLFKADDNSYIFFKSNSALEFVGKISGKDIAGTYETFGGDKDPQAELTYKADGADAKLYAKIDIEAGTITVSAKEDYSLNPVVYTADATARSAFDGKLYGFTVADKRVTVVFYEALGTADLFVESSNGVVADLKNVAYTYANNVATIVDGGTTYAFTYTADDADGTFAYDGQTFGLFDAWQTMACETLASYFGSYKTMGNWKAGDDDFKDRFDATAWRKMKVRYFVIDGQSGFNVGFYIDAGNNEGGISYWMKYIGKTETPGWHEFEVDLSTMSGNRSPALERLTGAIQLSYSGWLGNIGTTDSTNAKTPDGKDDNARDGYGMIIAEIYFYESRSVAVEGPSADKADCTHTGANGESLFVDNGVVASTCTTLGYTSLKCTNCGATTIDDRYPTLPSSGHVVDDTVAATVVAPTCDVDGYTYKICTVCGEQIVQETIKASGHVNHSYYDSTAEMMRVTCTICGAVSDYAYVETLLTGAEKLASTQFNSYATKYSFYVAENHNIGSVTSGTNFATKMDGNKATGGVLENGEYYWEFGRATTTTVTDAFFQFVPSDKMGVGVDFVYELDMMLGAKAANGQYLIMGATAKDRTHYGLGAQYGKDIQLFQLVGDGTIVFKEKGANNNNLVVQLSEKEYTNIAIAIHPGDNSYDVYVDGYLVYADIVAAPDDLSQFTLDCLRLSCTSTNQINETEGKASMYFNNIMLYPAEAPICVLTNNGGVVKEFSGDIALETAPKTPAGSAVSVTNAPVELSMPQYVVSTKYVLDFKLTAASLKNGAILSGVKLDEYRFENTLDLITVKGDYIYFLDTAICKVSDAAAGVQITLEADDKAGKTVVYVNGEAVPGGAIEYTADHGYYGSSGAYITSFIFDSEAGAYEITDLAMYTGSLKTDAEVTE